MKYLISIIEMPHVIIQMEPTRNNGYRRNRRGRRRSRRRNRQTTDSRITNAAPQLYIPNAKFRYQRDESIRQQIYELYTFKKGKNDPRGKAHNENICLNKIDDKLDQMYDKGFDFYRSKDQNLMTLFPEIEPLELTKPGLYMRHTCLSCNQSKANGSRKQPNQSKNSMDVYHKWTTMLGYFHFEVKFVPLNVFNSKMEKKQKKINFGGYRFNTPYMMIYSVRILRSKCKKCQQWGKAYVYDACLKTAMDQFCYFISQALNKKKYSQLKSTLRRKNMEGHEQQLCEACQLGYCRRGTQRRRRRRRNYRESNRSEYRSSSSEESPNSEDDDDDNDQRNERNQTKLQDHTRDRTNIDKKQNQDYW